MTDFMIQIGINQTKNLFMDSLSVNLKTIDEGLSNLVRLNQNLDNLDNHLKTIEPVIKSINNVVTALKQQSAIADIHPENGIRADPTNSNSLF